MSIKYIIGHWTGSNSYAPSEYEKGCYQLLVSGSGRVFEGKSQGKTASTGGMNSITYNISCCGGDNNAPMTFKQIEEFCFQTAKALKSCGLSSDKFYTHAEIGEMVRNYCDKQAGKNLSESDCKGRIITELLPWNGYLKANIGKIDLRKLPDKFGIVTNYTAQTSGDYLRNKIKWYLLNAV